MRGLLGSHAQSGLFWDVMCNMGSSRVSCPKKGLLGSHVRLQLGGLLGCHARGLVGCHVCSGSFGEYLGSHDQSGSSGVNSGESHVRSDQLLVKV